MTVGPYLPKLIRVRHHYSGLRDTAYNIHWLQAENDGPYTQDDLATAGTALGEIWSTDVVAYLAGNITYTGCEVADFTSALGNVADTSYTVTGGTGGHMAAQVAALWSLKTAERYRGGHGRSYIPCPGDGNMADDRNLSSTFITHMDDAISAYIAAIESLTLADGAAIWVVLHKKHGTESPYVAPVVSAECQAVVATMRRRLRKVARHRSA